MNMTASVRASLIKDNMSADDIKMAFEAYFDAEQQAKDSLRIHQGMRQLLAEARSSISVAMKAAKEKKIISSKEQELLRLRFVNGFTLKDIGFRYGVGVERTRQMLAKAVERVTSPDPIIL